MNAPNPKEINKLLHTMIESLGQASGGCAQMTHHRGDPRWIVMRQAVDLVRDDAINKASNQIAGSPLKVN